MPSSVTSSDPPSLFSWTSEKSSTSGGSWSSHARPTDLHTQAVKRDLGMPTSDLSSLKDGEGAISVDQVDSSSLDEQDVRALIVLTDAEMNGGTALYNAAYKGFKEIMLTLSKQKESDSEALKSIQSFEYWMESQFTRPKIWAEEIGVDDSVLYALRISNTKIRTVGLQKLLFKYLVSIYEALNLVGERLSQMLAHINLVKEKYVFNLSHQAQANCNIVG